MSPEDFELEEFVIAVAVRLTLHDLDHVVGPFQRACRDRVIVVVQDSLLMFFEGVGTHPHPVVAKAADL
jgi:hypothetical protein